MRPIRQQTVPDDATINSKGEGRIHLREGKPKWGSRGALLPPLLRVASVFAGEEGKFHANDWVGGP